MILLSVTQKRPETMECFGLFVLGTRQTVPKKDMHTVLITPNKYNLTKESFDLYQHGQVVVMCMIKSQSAPRLNYRAVRIPL